MSAHFCTSSSEPIRPGYARLLLAAIACWFIAYLAIVWVVNPYGVAPFDVSIPHVNTYRPKRLDIDRLIKPLEVWMKQPKTVFLGTSRIHQSIDPSLMDGTDFAPAYNASVPAVALAMNTSYLELYDKLDPKLERVFVELFYYNFVGQGQSRSEISMESFRQNAITLNLSMDALRDTISTVGYNLLINKPIYEIKPGGYFYYPPGHPAAQVFTSFPKGMWDLYRNSPGGYKLHEPAFGAAGEIAQVADAHGIDLHFIATPNHAYFDYFIDLVGAWDLVEEWLTRLSAIAPIYSFAQPNDWTYEEAVPGMKYWNDPFHFSLEMGRGIQTAILGQKLEGRPENFMRVLRPEDIPAHIAERKRAIRTWAQAHPDFVKAIDDARKAAGF